MLFIVIISILVVHLSKRWPIKKCAKCFTASLKNAKPPRGTYLSEMVEGTILCVSRPKRGLFCDQCFS